MEVKGASLLNRCEEAFLRTKLLECCSSRCWVEGMMKLRPFPDDRAVHAAAAQAWSEASDDDILEAIASHPRIGAEKLKTKWASGEQAGVAGAAAPTLEALARLNDSYFDKFGYTFLVCATGKTAENMLSLLVAREGNDATTELKVAAAEQSKITSIRLDKLMGELAGMRPPLTTHVLDTAKGSPAQGLPIKLEILQGSEGGAAWGDSKDSEWRVLGEAKTNNDGRLNASLIPVGAPLLEATYRVTFDTAAYFEAQTPPQRPFYPEVTVVFSIPAPSEHYHIPLLLSPFGYSTYRGS